MLNPIILLNQAMPLKEHLTNSLKITPGPSPKPRMVLSALSISLPLLIGKFENQIGVSMFGALFALVLILNDHFGPLKKRILHLFTTFLLLTLSLLLGNFLIGHALLTYIALFFGAFLLGKVKDQGIVLERMVLFCVLYMITIADSPGIKSHIEGPITYSSMAFAIYITILTLIYFIKKDTLEFVRSKRKTLKVAINKNASNYFSVIYATTVMLSFIFSKYIQVDRAYWVTGTVLVVMLPDTYKSYYKAFQRLLGTILGVLMASTCLSFIHTPFAIILFVFVFAFFSPLGMMRNYWIGNLFIAALIVFFLETASATPHFWQMSYLRIIDISLGCLIGILSTYFFISKPLENISKKEVL